MLSVHIKNQKGKHRQVTQPPQQVSKEVKGDEVKMFKGNSLNRILFFLSPQFMLLLLLFLVFLS